MTIRLILDMDGVLHIRITGTGTWGGTTGCTDMDFSSTLTAMDTAPGIILTGIMDTLAMDIMDIMATTTEGDPWHILMAEETQEVEIIRLVVNC
jgi:hypothetical protein